MSYLLPGGGYASLMRPNKAETAVHGCHCLGDMAVRMRKVLARPWVGVRVSLAFMLFFNNLRQISHMHCDFPTPKGSLF